MEKINKIYVYSCPLYEGLLKIGQTMGNVDARIMQQFPQHPRSAEYKPYKILLVINARDNHGGVFQDSDRY